MANKTISWHNAEKKFPEANFLQSPSWAKMNELIGHKTITEDFDGRGWCLMIIKNAKRGRYLEIPAGPLIDWQNDQLTQEVFQRIREIAQHEKCVFIRLRPQLYQNPQNQAILEKIGCQKAPMHLHAEHTVMLDLTQTEEKLLANMRRQTRYEVRRSEKQKLTVTWSNDQDIFEKFQQAQAETAARQGFIPPDLKTLLAEREAFGDQIRIYAVKTPKDTQSINSSQKTKDNPIPSNQPIAYGLILWSGEEAEYFEAASTDLNHKLPGAYALQWQVIKDLKKLGLKRYNLWGIAPQGAKNHRYSGVTTFKTGFGGKVVEFVPAQDIVINRFGYIKDWAIETIRRKTRKL